MSKKLNYPKLPTRFKEKWLTFLRSDKYKQGKNKLHNKEENTFCCLGVACVAAKVSPINIHGGFINNLPEFKKVPAVLRYGTKASNKDENNIQSKLSVMNDNGRSFKQIANWIEKHL